MVGGLDQGPASNMQVGGGPHSRGSGTFLTCVPFTMSADRSVQVAKTMDQMVATEFSRETQIAIATKVRDASGGYGAWPHCASVLGLPR